MNALCRSAEESPEPSVVQMTDRHKQSVAQMNISYSTY